MEAIVKSMLVSMYYHEAWGDGADDGDITIEALSATASVLKDANPEEIAVLDKVLRGIVLSHEDPEFRLFCEGFIEHYIEKYEENWK